MPPSHTDAHVLPDGAGSLRELLWVAIPLMISSGSLSAMGIIDRLLITGLSMDALAASMPAGMLHWTIMSIPFGIVTYVNTFVAQYEGAGRKEQVAACIWQGLWLSLLGGLAIILLIPLTRLVFQYNGHRPAVQELEIGYYTVLAFGSAPMLASNVLAAFFSGRGRTITVMLVYLAAMVVNAVLDYVLIFGWGPIPQLGMAGAALATVLANVVICAIFAWLARREGRLFAYPFRQQLSWNPKLLWRMFQYGLPNGIQMMIDVGAYFVFVSVTGVIGPEALAATNLAFNLNSMAFVPMFGMGTAVLSLVGRRVGELRADLAVRTTWLAAGLSVTYMAMFGVLYVGLPNLLLAPYAHFALRSSSPEEFEAIRPIVIVLLRFVATYSLFDALAIVFGHAIRGAGDVRYSLVLTSVLAWSVMAVPCIVMAYVTPAGLYGCWIAATANIVLLGLGMMWRFHAGHWRSLRVID